MLDYYRKKENMYANMSQQSNQPWRKGYFFSSIRKSNARREKTGKNVSCFEIEKNVGFFHLGKIMVDFNVLTINHYSFEATCKTEIQNDPFLRRTENV